jgi:hypothetical protein
LRATALEHCAAGNQFVVSLRTGLGREDEVKLRSLLGQLQDNVGERT